MPTLDLGIDSSALGQLTELPEQVLAAVAAAREALDGASPSEPSNALGGLLSGLAAIPDQIEGLPAVGDALSGLTALAGLIPAELTHGAGALESIGAVTALLGPMSALATGDLDAAVAAAVDKLGDAAGTIAQQAEGSVVVADELRELFTLLAALDGWTAHAPPAEEVARLLAKAFLGADLDILAVPLDAMRTCLASIEDVLPGEDDLDQWRSGLAAMEATWAAFEARVAVPSVDWVGLELDLQVVARSQAELVVLRDQLLSVVVAALVRVDLSGLAAVATALRQVPEVPEVRLTPILDGFVAQLRSLRDGLEHWDLSPDDARRVVRGLVQRLLDAVEGSAIGQIRRWLLSFEQRVLSVIEGLPLRVVADEITGALRSIEAAIGDVDLEGLIAPVTELGDTIAAAIADLSTSGVSDTLGQAWAAVEDALGEAASLLEALRATLDDVTGPVTDFAERVGPAVTGITDLLAQVRVVLEAFDLAEPTARVLDALHRARDVVAGIDLSAVPADALQPVKQALDALADVDVSAAITGTITELLDAIDPGPALQEAAAVLADAAVQLAAIDPSHLVATLDAPVEEILGGLAALDPSLLATAIDQAVAPVREAIGRLDAGALLAPASRAFAEMLAQLDALLDPGPVFAPLQDAYQPIIDAVEALEPGRLIELIAPHAESLTGSLGEAAGAQAGPEAVLGDAAGFASLPSVVDVADDLFGFRPGDLLVPLVDLHHRLMTAVEGLTSDLLEEVAATLHEAFGGGLAALRPDAVLERFDEALARVDAELGVVATTTAVVDAALGYQRVAAAVAGQARVATGADVAVSLRVTASLPALDPLRVVARGGQAAALSAAASVARGRADVGVLRSAYAVGVARLEALLPSFLGDGLDGSGLLGALRSLDPAPVRDEVNRLFDEAGHLLAGLGDVVTAAFEEAARAAEDLLLPLNPSALLALVTRIHAGLVAQVQALSPAALADHVRLVFAAVRRQLEALDPGQLTEQVDAVRSALLAALDGVVDGLLPDAEPFRELQIRLEALRPSALLAPVMEALAPVSGLVAAVDPDALVQPLLDAIDRVKDQVPEVIAQVEEAFDEVLHAFPEGGGSSGSASVSIG